MIMHNHIDQRARLPEECPACEKVWRSIENTLGEHIVREELNYALALYAEYGPNEMLHHLTDTRELLLREAWREKRYA